MKVAFVVFCMSIFDFHSPPLIWVWGNNLRDEYLKISASETKHAWLWLDPTRGKWKNSACFCHLGELTLTHSQSSWDVFKTKHILLDIRSSWRAKWVTRPELYCSCVSAEHLTESEQPSSDSPAEHQQGRYRASAGVCESETWNSH